MFQRSLLALYGASGVIAASCLGVSTVTALSTTTIYSPATTFQTVSSTTSTAIHTLTVTSAITTTITSTTYTGPALTAFTFLPGNPPAKRDLKQVEARAVCNADNCLRALRAMKVLSSAQIFCSSYTETTSNPASFPTYIPSECNASRVSSACSCLPAQSSTSACTTPTTISIVTISLTSVATSTTTAIVTAYVTSTTTASPTVLTKTYFTSPSPASTKTVYPCATPLVNFQGPAYGDSSNTSNLDLQNSLYYLNTPQGASAAACCNLCYFGLANCVQAYWYSYEGCVVSQATDLSSGTGKGVSSSCPVGTFGGLTYGPDVNPAFRSTGNIAGPCGVGYTNF